MMVEGRPGDTEQAATWAGVHSKMLRYFGEHSSWASRWFETLFCVQDELAGTSSTDARSGAPMSSEQVAQELVALQRFVLDKLPVWVFGSKATRGIMDPTSYNPGPPVAAGTLAGGTILLARPPASLHGIEALVWSRQGASRPDQTVLSVVVYRRPAPGTVPVPVGAWAVQDDMIHSAVAGNSVLELLELAWRVILHSDIQGVQLEPAAGTGPLVLLD
jgi:hypothetical protein